MSKTLTWDEAAKAMKDEGYAYTIPRQLTKRLNLDHSYAWRISDENGPVFKDSQVRSHVQDPVVAINDLLRQCRERWPTAHPWDGMTMDELVKECRERNWNPEIQFRFKEPSGYFWVAGILMGVSMQAGDTPEEALRWCMKWTRDHEAKS